MDIKPVSLFRTLVAVSFALFLGLPTPPALAGAITISDLTDGPPVLTISSDIDVISSILTDESWSLNGIFHIPFGNGTLTPGVQSFGLTEPAGAGGGDIQGSISDVVFLTVPNFGGPVGNDWQQGFQLSFGSDPFALDDVTPSILLPEDGTMQTMPINNRNLANETVFDVSVQSDKADIPEPATLALLGLGLAGVAATRRSKLN